MDLVNAQKARQILDRLIGYKISPILWFTIGSGTSAGRVQSIALKLVCQKEVEIKNFKPQDFWYIDALLKCNKGEFWARVVTKDKDNRYLDDKLSSDDLEKLKKATYKLDDIERNEKCIKAYPPFDTSSLQTSGSSLFGWSVKKTATLAQALYEQGKVTYIRTDSYHISEDALKEVRGFIKDKYESKYLPDSPIVHAKKSKSAAQEAHECIRPTSIVELGDDIADSDEQKLYKLIRDRFIACQMNPMIVDTLIYKVAASTKHTLIARGQTIKFDGWTKAYKYSKTEETILPEASKGENLDLKDIKRTKHTTQPPSRYNEGSLVKKMEGEGVGRPSTYPSIMESIQKRGYVQKNKKGGALEATELGMRVFNYLDPNFNTFFMNIGFTAKLEDSLDEVAEGKKGFLDVIKSTYEVLQEEIKKAKGNAPQKSDVTTGEKCSICEKGFVVQRHGKFGDFFACDQYPTCKTVFVKGEDGKFKIKEKKVLKITDRSCPDCQKEGREGKLVERKNKADGSAFYGCTLYPKCKYSESLDGVVKGKSYKKYDKSSKYSKSEEDSEPTKESGDDVLDID